MMMGDTHSHAGINWFEPVEMILLQMNLNGVEKTVLIQHAGNYHNRYIIESVKRFPGPQLSSGSAGTVLFKSQEEKDCAFGKTAVQAFELTSQPRAMIFRYRPQLER